MSGRSFRSAICFLVLLYAAAARADDGTPKEKAEEAALASFAFVSHIRQMPSRSVKAMPGEVGLVDSSLECSFEHKVSGRLPVVFTLQTQYVGIDDTVSGVDLPSHLVGISTDIETTFPFLGIEKTYLRLGLSPSFYSDDWDFESSALRIPSRLFLIHLPNERWTLLAGVGIWPDYETEAFPILGFIYKPNDRLTFNIVPKRPTVSYLLNERATLFAEGGSSLNSEFEVERSGSENLVLQYNQTRLGGGLRLRPLAGLSFSASAGGVFNRSLKYRDGTGKVVLKDGWYSEFRIEMRR